MTLLDVPIAVRKYAHIAIRPVKLEFASLGRTQTHYLEVLHSEWKQFQLQASLNCRLTVVLQVEASAANDYRLATHLSLLSSSEKVQGTMVSAASMFSSLTSAVPITRPAPAAPGGSANKDESSWALALPRTTTQRRVLHILRDHLCLLPRSEFPAQTARLGHGNALRPAPRPVQERVFTRYRNNSVWSKPHPEANQVPEAHGGSARQLKSVQEVERPSVGNHHPRQNEIDLAVELSAVPTTSIRHPSCRRSPIHQR